MNNQVRHIIRKGGGVREPLFLFPFCFLRAVKGDEREAKKTPSTMHMTLLPNHASYNQEGNRNKAKTSFLVGCSRIED